MASSYDPNTQLLPKTLIYTQFFIDPSTSAFWLLLTVQQILLPNISHDDHNPFLNYSLNTISAAAFSGVQPSQVNIHLLEAN